MTGHPIWRIAVLLVSVALVTVALTSSALAAKPKCGGKVATIVGTNKGEVIRGTMKADVIVAKGGKDVIRGRGGNDTICGGLGADKLVGGGGKDKLNGGDGNDGLYGGDGRDTLKGKAGNDTMNGGDGVDTCWQGTGTGKRVDCEVPAIRPPKVLAIAYSDLDGNHEFGTGDVLISKLLDANYSGKPDAGDTIKMGQYPTRIDPTSTAHFALWGVRNHTVTQVLDEYTDYLRVQTKSGADHSWAHASSRAETYRERNGATSLVQDGFVDPSYPNMLAMDPSSPSQPGTRNPPNVVDPTDNRLIDVDLLY